MHQKLEISVKDRVIKGMDISRKIGQWSCNQAPCLKKLDLGYPSRNLIKQWNEKRTGMKQIF